MPGPNFRLRLHPLDYASAVGMLTYASSATITPICLVILARELSFSLVGAGVIEAVRSALLLVALLGSGFISAHWGKPLSLGLSCLVLGCGMLLYSVAPVYGAILLGVALLGLGGGILEGLMAPLIHDLHPRDSGRYLNFINGFWSVGVLLTMLLAGESLTQGISWRSIAAVLGAFSMGAGALFLLLRGRIPAAPRFAVSEVLAHKRRLAGMPRFWIFMAMMFTAGAAEGAFTFWSATYIQLQHDTLPRAGGAGAALFAAGMVIGRFGGGLWVRQHNLRVLIFASASAGIVVSLLFPFTATLPAAFAALFLAGLSVASFWPSLQSYAADRLPVETTSLFILLSVAGIPGFAFASWAIGLIGERAGLNAAFLLIPCFFAALALLLVIEGRWHEPGLRPR